MDPFQTWNQSKNMRMELRPSYVSAYARIRKIETTVIWHPFLPVKPHGHFLHFFSKKSLFFRPKKGSPNRLILFLKARLGGSTFRTPKNRCVKLPVSTSMCPPPYFPLAKMNYFSDEGRRRRRRTNISDFALPKVMALRAKSD